MMDEHEHREMMGLLRNNKNLSSIVDEKSGLIRILKESNKSKDKFICDLIKELIKKDNQILQLKEGHEFIEKWLRWNQKKQIGDHR